MEQVVKELEDEKMFFLADTFNVVKPENGMIKVYRPDFEKREYRLLTEYRVNAVVPDLQIKG